MTKVAMVVFSFYPADPRVRREAEALRDKGMEVHVLCLRAQDECNIEEFGSIKAYRIMNGTDNKEGFIQYVFLTVLFTILAFVALIRLAVQHRYSAIQFHNMPDYLVFAGLMHKILGRPIILDLHDLTPELFESKWGTGRAKHLIRLVKFMERIACRFSNQIITTSVGFQNRLVERGISKCKIALVLNSANPLVFRRERPQEFNEILKNVKLLYHGTVARRFGLHVLIEALDGLRTEIPNTHLSVYGKYDPTYRAELEEMITRLGLGANVALLGYLSQEEVRKEIEMADIGIVPYLSDVFMGLALSTKTFEYVVMKLPVIAARLPSLTSIFGDESVTYFEPGDPIDLKNKIAEVCTNGNLRQTQTERAFAAYSDFSWPIMSKRYVNLIETLVSPERK